MRHSILFSISFAASLLLAVPCTAAETPARPPVEAFFDNPELSSPLLSPSGKYIAIRVGGKGNYIRLAVYEIATGKANIVASFDDANVNRVQWVNDDRLLYDSSEPEKGYGQMRYAPGLFAVNRDGTQFRRLAERNNPFVRQSGSEKLLPWHTYMMPQAGPQNSEYVYVASREYRDKGDLAHVTLLRLNTVSGRHTAYYGPHNVQYWVMDYGGEPRLAVSAHDDVTTIHYRDPKQNNEWRKITEHARYFSGPDTFDAMAFGPDGKFYVRTAAKEDKSAVYTFDLDTGKLSDQPVIRTPGFDFSGYLIFNDKGLQGIRTITDGDSMQWVDKDMQGVQDAVDKLLEGTVNVVTPPRQGAVPNYTVKAYSDSQPAVYFVYDGARGKLIRVGSKRPQIKGSQMGNRALVHYQARDGLTIPAWLTTPNGGGKQLPMVVLVHGGPWARGGTLEFEDDAQFLASRGYLVLQPEFRGSIGYGNALFRAGWKQWGLKMQDDVADGVKWAVAQGYADSRRVCIAGANYGGYSALMGLVNDPDLYRCGLIWAGITDIELLYKGTWYAQNDLPEAWKKYGMPVMVGDLEKDAAQLKQTSPLAQAARIRQPVLLAYGAADPRVPIHHGKRFYDAAIGSNKQLEWIEYPEEGHSLLLPKNRFDFWTRVENFLDRNIGAGAKTE
jgi:dipeptidyl aminopeptidase/acylaminoacyl peptidase